MVLQIRPPSDFGTFYKPAYGLLMHGSAANLGLKKLPAISSSGGSNSYLGLIHSMQKPEACK